ncbi:FecR family protein [Flavobacterium sp. PL12]|uniref:FecR family protein n=1 Tax=Flavobacterium sp. PL12 TaxID=3071718 RepID=UPI00319E15B6
MHKRNDFTEIEDFLSDESFRRWAKYQVDQHHWEEWTLENPKRAKLVEEARLWILAMKVERPILDEKSIESALDKTWSKINEAERARPLFRKQKQKIWQYNWITSAATAVLFGALIFSYFNTSLFSNDSTLVYHELIQENEEGLVEQTNNSNKPQIITLSDGSSVLLLPDSKLSYPKAFLGNERKVYLSGEGFFEISKNRKKPFYVYANEIVTKVVGTSFRIRAYENQPNIEVLVHTGQVNIKSNESVEDSSTKEYVLLPNQAVRFIRKGLTFNKISESAADKTLSQTKNNIEDINFSFADAPVSKILELIENAYLVEIDFPKDKLKNCYLTTSLNDQPLPEKLKIVCKSLGNNTTYEMNGNQIIITSEGCD